MIFKYLSRVLPCLSWVFIFKTKYSKTILLFLLLLIIPSVSFASVVINEIAWMGTEKSYSDEWIELYNNSDFSVSLEGWTLSTQDKKINITLDGEIPPNNFFLLERTDDNTVPNKKADLIYKGGLSNKGTILLLKNKENTVDFVDCLSGWPEGNNTTKATMERVLLSQSWQTSNSAGGTPKETNGENIITENSNPEKSFISSNIFINEIMPSPEGPDSENEWIELYNNNNFKVNLFDYKIKDSYGKTKEFILDKRIEAKGFYLIKRTDSKISLNNEKDTVILIDPKGEKVDSVSYENAPEGKSFNRDEGVFYWGEPTPGNKNNPFVENKPKKEKEEKEETKQLAEIKRPSLDYSFLRILLIGLLVSIISGTLILLLRKRLEEIND